MGMFVYWEVNFYLLIGGRRFVFGVWLSFMVWVGSCEVVVLKVGGYFFIGCVYKCYGLL